MTLATLRYPALLALVCLTACDRQARREPESTTTAAATAPADRSSEVDRELWAATCPEVMLGPDLAKGPPPPPPPPPLPAKLEDLPVGEDAPAAEFPERVVALPRPRGSDLAARLGLSSDACDPLPLVRLHDQHPKDEALYCAIAFAFEECGQLDQAMDWAKRRAADFPDSADARIALGIRRLEALRPEDPVDMAAKLPYAQRLAIASELVADAEAALSLRPDDQVAHTLAVLGHIQKYFARTPVVRSETVQDQLELLLQRNDSMAAWSHIVAAQRARGLTDCNENSEGECVLPPPLSEEEQAEHAKIEARLRAKIEEAREQPG